MHKRILVCIFLLALALRSIGVSDVPAGFTPDEASFGYDAYSILKTGKDQWGQTFPLVLESFGDFKPPLYAYILAPFVGVFGLNEWVVRLPNALIGSLAVIATYYLILEFGKLGESGNIVEKYGKPLGLIAALLVAASPWHIMMSRGGFEANLTTFILPLGVYGFLRGIRGTGYKAWLVVSTLAFGLNLFSYHSARLVTPLIVFTLLILCRKEFLKLPKRNIVSFLGIFSIFVILTVYTFSQGAGARASDISIYSGSMQAAAHPRLEAINSGVNPTVAKMIHNRFIVTANRFITNYSQYYSPKFLFFDGSAEATYGMIPGRGVLYSFEVVFLIGFLFAAWRNRRSRIIWVIAFWLLVAPIPAAMATGIGFAGNRSVIMIPAIQIALAIGAVFVYDKLVESRGHGRYRAGIVTAFLGIVVISLISFVNEYRSEQPLIGAPAMLYGRREMVDYLSLFENKYDRVFVSRSLSEPHIYFAFYKKWNPVDYQAQTEDWRRYRDENLKFLDQLGEYGLGEYEFRGVDYESLDDTQGILFVGKPEEFSENTGVLHIVHFPNGEPAVFIADPNKDAYAKYIDIDR